VGKNLPSALGERVSVKLEEIDGLDEVVLEI
jgi:pyrimidine operon attenuation protein/uracil phosphoribosyltransferase